MVDWPRLTILLHGLAESAADLSGCAAARDATAVAKLLELMEMQIEELREQLGRGEPAGD